MLRVGDKVKEKESLVASWPKWARDYYLSRTGEIIEIHKLGYVRVLWDKPRWDDPTRFVDTDWSGFLVRVGE